MTGPDADDLVELIAAIAATFHKLRAAGKRLGAVSPMGGGTWGLLRSLALGGPQTVPALARARPVARQHIQVMVDALAAQGLVTLIANPRHKRSRLVALTPAGEAAFAALDGRVRAAASKLAPGLDADDVATATAVLRALARRLDDGLVRPRRR